MPEARLGARGTAAVAVLSLTLMVLTSSLTLTSGAVEGAPSEQPGVAAAKEPQPTTMVLKRDDGTMDGKRSLAASGHFVQFQCPPGKWHLTEVQIFGSRYGSVQPPLDKFTITLCDKQFKTIKYIRKPYSIFAERGQLRGHQVPVPPLELPSAKVTDEGTVPAPFWINVAFNPSRTKGVYMGYDSSDSECFSRTGLPDQKPGDIKEKYDWMIRLVITDDPPKEVHPNLAQWMEPRKPLVPWDQAGLTELKNEDGESDAMESISGAGPVVRFEGVPEGAKLTRLRMYASRYGSGFDPETTYADYYVYDDEMRIIQTGRISYSLFTHQERWVDVPLKPVKVPAAFSVLINPNAHKYKGIYTHYDTDTPAGFARCGRTPEETWELNWREPFTWMIRAYVEAPQAEG